MSHQRRLDRRNAPNDVSEPRRQRFLKPFLAVALLAAILCFGYWQYEQNPQLFSIASNAFGGNPTPTLQITETLVENMYASTPTPEPPNVTWLETRVHELINAQRTANKRNGLRWNDALANASRKHSADMAAKSYVSHDSPEGHDLTWRYTQEGFGCTSDYGENLNQEWTFETTWYATGVEKTMERITQEKLAENIVTDWMNSEDHRNNILTPEFMTEGIGIAITPEGEVYATEDFC